MGKLVVVGTPIGNLGDLSIRAARCLLEVDAVLCEDTRRTGKLLAHARSLMEQLADPDEGVIAGPAGRPTLVVVNEHTEWPRLPEVLDRLQAGQTVALVSDAGMPTISDPGYAAVHAAASIGHTIEVVPGPSAVSAGLAVSGLPADRYVFEGFLPRKGTERAERLEALAADTRTVVLYEAPHRLVRTLRDLAGVGGADRPVAVARELTKIHEEVWRGPVSVAAEHFDRVEPRGEFVIVVAGATENSHPPTDEELRAQLRHHLATGMSKRDAAAEVSAATGVSRRRAYDLANTLD